MEQADQQQQEPRADGSTRDPEEEPALETEGAAAEQAFSLLQDLPGPLMRQLVQRHLDGAALLALLRTSDSLARAVVQHHTHQQRRPFTWIWWSCLDARWDRFIMDEAQAAAAASLLERWAPAELQAALLGSISYKYGYQCSWASLPLTAPPLITHLELCQVDLTPATMGSLQRCHRLHTLHVERCSTAEAPAWEQSPLSTLQALPLLRTFRYRTDEHKRRPWALQALGTLCALATKVQSDLWFHDWAHHFTHATHWVVEHSALTSETLEALLRLPALRYVRAPRLSLTKDHSQQACQWEALTVEWLHGVSGLQQLPSGMGCVLVLGLSCKEHREDVVAAALQRWGPGRLQLQVDAPPGETTDWEWRLGDEERRGGRVFRLGVRDTDALAAHAPLLRQTLFSPGGGPHTLELVTEAVCHVEAITLQLAPLLEGTRVRTLCVQMGEGVDGWRGLLGALPASITCVRLGMRMMQQAAEVVSGDAVTRPLRVALRLLHNATENDKEELRELCAAHQPLVELEVT